MTSTVRGCTRLVLTTFILFILLGVGYVSASEIDYQGDYLLHKNESTILTAERIFDPVVIDGLITESSWTTAKVLVITIQDGSIGQIDVELKALYDDNYFYLYASWPDTTKNINKNHLTYDKTSNIWTRSEDEDGIAILWNIGNSIHGFNIGGCAMTCHGDRKSTNGEGEMGDMWQWMAASTDPVGIAYDSYLDVNFTDAYGGFTALHSDGRLDTGIITNYDFDNQVPIYMQNPGITPSSGEEFLLMGEEVEFDPIYKDPENNIEWEDGDCVPGYLLEEPSGIRADIEAKSTWVDGRWHVEFRRLLITGNSDDVEFDITNIYRFGVAVMDNSGGFRRYGEGHSFDLGARTLEFGGEGSEVITTLALVREYLMVAKGYMADDNSALAKSEINNAYSIFERIENEVVDKDPQRYLDTKNAFDLARSKPDVEEVDSLINEIDELILLFQGKIEPTTPSWEANVMAFWTKIETYVFIILSILALYLLYLIIRTISKKEWRRMSIFLLIISIPIFLEGIGRMGVVADIHFFYNLSFMTNEYAKLMWGILMFCAIVFSTLGFRDLDNNIKMLKKTEEEIKYLNAFNENVLRTVPIGIMVVEVNGKVAYDNPMLNKIGDVIKSGDSKINLINFKKSREKSILYSKYRAAITKGESFEILKYPFKYGTDQVIYLNIKGGPLKNVDGIIEGVLILFEDVTDRIKLEEKLFHSEKLASIGQLAAGVAHELNTPLMNISLVTENVGTLTEDDKILKNIKIIENQVYNAAKIVDDLLLFSRKKKAESIPININEALNNTINQLKEKIPDNIEIIKDFDKKLPMVHGDSSLIGRLFINLIQNAIDAMPEGGKLTLVTEKKKGGVKIKIKDSGIGISQDKIKEIFNPFYTTKGPGKGTGLGLAICHGIVNEHKGDIFLKSKEGIGTTISVNLPR